MDPVRLGHAYRALRIRARMRQADVAALANVSASAISRVERGRIGTITLGKLRRISEALDADLEVRLRWNGEGLDRLLDQAHAALVEILVERLRAAGWEVEVEASFAIAGERGSVDVAAYHRERGIVLVVEAKSVVPDSQATLHGLDRKARLAPHIRSPQGVGVSRGRTVARDRRFRDLAPADRAAGLHLRRGVPDGRASGGQVVARASRPDLRTVVCPILAAHER